jgi:hypothetical protein
LKLHAIYFLPWFRLWHLSSQGSLLYSILNVIKVELFTSFKASWRYDPVLQARAAPKDRAAYLPNFAKFNFNLFKRVHTDLLALRHSSRSTILYGSQRARSVRWSDNWGQDLEDIDN